MRVRSPLLAQSLNCFLFLQVLRCFSSLGLLLLLGNMSSTCWVAPFGNLRINFYLRIPVAYRSLSRPSSPPRAKAFPIRPYLLLLTIPFNKVYSPFGIFPMCSLFVKNPITLFFFKTCNGISITFYYSFSSMSMNSFVPLLPVMSFAIG